MEAVRGAWMKGATPDELGQWREDREWATADHWKLMAVLDGRPMVLAELYDKKVEELKEAREDAKRWRAWRK